MAIALTPADSMVGAIHEVVRDGGTQRIGVPSSSRPTIPPDTGPPGQAHASTWQQEIGEIAGRAAVAGARQLIQELRADAKHVDETSPNPGPRQRASTTSILALAFSILALLGLGTFVVLHQSGNTEYERVQAEANAALAKELAAATEALRVQSLANNEFRLELGAQRRAIYGLIDVIAESNPKARNVERDLLQR